MNNSEQNTYIEFKNVSLKFKLYSDKGISIKEAIVNRIMRKNRMNAYKEFWVLKDLNVSFYTGDRVGVIGCNGAGKSTFLKLISRIYTPTEGTIDLSGRVAPLIELGAGFNPELTGRENILLNGVILGFKPSEIKTLEQDIVEFSGISEFIDYPVKYYSTGMYTRLAFTVATAIQPDILIVDEVFAGGDINFIDKATNRLNSLFESSKILFAVSHDMETIRKLCNRCLVLHEHKILFDGNVEDAIALYYKLNAT